MAMNDDQLTARVNRAFTRDHYPEANEIVADVPKDLEREEIRDYFAGKVWTAIPDEMLRYHAEALAFFTPRAWAYYIPAYLNTMVRDLVEADYVPEMIVASLQRYGDAYRPYLDSLQRETVADALRWLLERRPDHPKRGAIEEIVRSLGS